MTRKSVILPAGLPAREANAILQGWIKAGLRAVNGVVLADLELVPAPAGAHVAARPWRGTTRGARHLAWERR